MCLICNSTDELAAAGYDINGRVRGKLAYDQRRADMLGAMIEYWMTPGHLGHAESFLVDRGFSVVEIKDHAAPVNLLMCELKDRKLIPMNPK